MTLREKIGQMFMIDLKDGSFTPEVVRQVDAGSFGNVILFEKNLQDYDQTRLLIRRLQTHALVQRGVPMLVAVDQEGGIVNRLGGVTQFKSMRHSARTLGAVYDYAPRRATRLVNQLTAEVAAWMKGLGFNMNLAPVLDLTSDKSSYIYDRSYGGDPDKVSEIARQYAATMRRHGIVTTGKHFPNLSFTRTDSHKALPILDRTLVQLTEHEFVPFERLSEELSAIMVGHVMVPQLDPKHPASVSSRITRILREDIGFDGVIISDDLKMRALSDRYSLREIVLRCVLADIDLMIMAWDRAKQLEAVDVLEQAVRKGHIKPARIDASVRRILALKSRFAR
jgi:beta-N-acetylhexosaminidase